MSDHNLDSVHASGNGGYEKEDLSPRSIFYFMAGLVVFALLIHLAIVGVYVSLDRYDRAHQPAVSPLVKTNPNTRSVTRTDTQEFPLPRLEESEIRQLNDVIRSQDEKLATYGWVDEKAGKVRIPIDRAMEIVAQRGLPVMPQGATQSGTKIKNESAMPKANAAAPPTR